ncbi:hypothetical protein D4R47_04225 [archaeon]|nr:MAG: hypothetical protein D4R47_04225 [archaeon]
MHKKRVPTGLRWFFFVLGIGTMISAGIYLKGYIAGGTMLEEGLRALMFFLLGLFFTLMYGENKQAPEEDTN